MSTPSHRASQTTFQYVVGFCLALLLTFITYGLVVERWYDLKTGVIAAIILGLAGLQALVQSIFFLHLGAEREPRWKSVTFAFTVLMMLIVVVASLWVMHNLNYRMGMSPEQMQETMLKENGKGF